MYLCGHDSLYEKGRTLERRQPRRRHRAGCGSRRAVSGMVCSRQGQLGHGRRHSLPDRYARQLHHQHGVPRPSAVVALSRGASALGPRCHLLAHRRFVLASHVDCSARCRSVGLGSFLLRLGRSHRRYHRQLPWSEGPQPRGDSLLRNYGAFCPRRLPPIAAARGPHRRQLAGG